MCSYCMFKSNFEALRYFFWVRFHLIEVWVRFDSSLCNMAKIQFLSYLSKITFEIMGSNLISLKEILNHIYLCFV